MAQSNSSMREGLIVGVIGYVSIALLYTIFDFFAVRGSLFTVDLLAKFVFRGLRDPSVLALPIELDMVAIFWYNALTLLVALIVGFIVVSLVRLSENKQLPAKLIFVILFSGFLFTIAVIALMTSEIRQLLPLWSIIVANSIAVILGGRYLAAKHPGIWKRLNPVTGSSK